MVQNAVARQLLHDLRQQIAAIEGTLPQRFAEPVAVQPDAMAARQTLKAGEIDIVRQNGLPAGASHTIAAPHLLRSGAAAFDDALGGGLPQAALCEIYGREARDAGAVSGFALALASLTRRQRAEQPGTTGSRQSPLLWVGTADMAAETGFPHTPGITGLFDIPYQALLFAQAGKPLDALWIAGEAAGLSALGAIIIEIRGNPPSLDLTATRRLHRRARTAGRPVFLLRVSATKEPTAAPVRLCVFAAPARPREIFGRPLNRSLGAPAFNVEINKCRANPGRHFTLEWKNDEQRFCERQPEGRVAVVSSSVDRQDHAPALRPVVAFEPGRRRQAG